MAEKCSTFFGVHVTVGQLKSRMFVIKSQFYDLKHLINEVSGFGWDHNRRMIMAEDTTWDNLIKKDKKYKKWRDKSIDLYGDWFKIFDGTRAKGKGQHGTLSPTTSVLVPSGSHTTPASSPQYEESASSPDVEVRSSPKRRFSGKSTTSKGKCKQSRVDDEDHNMSSALREVAEALRETGPPPSRQTLIAQCMNIIMTMEELTTEEKVAAAVRLESNPTTPTIFLKFNHECRLA